MVKSDYRSVSLFRGREAKVSSLDSDRHLGYRVDSPFWFP
jgi:hypothetical protein